jgi:O-acetylhomoserine/O-acetylserine sulfhydrylase-like pyridoxal-dependent enzyme
MVSVQVLQERIENLEHVFEGSGDANGHAGQYFRLVALVAEGD